MISLLKIGIQSGDLYYDSNYEWGLDIVKDAGFDCIDFNIDQKISYGDTKKGIKNTFFAQSDEALREYYRPQKLAMEDRGITMSQMHGPFPVYCPGNAEATDVLINATIKSIMLCEFFGCPYLVVHPVKADNLKLEWEINHEIYMRLLPAAQKYGVGICLENMFADHAGHVIESVCSDFERAAGYIDALNDEAGEKVFSFCFDVGHANLLGKDLRGSINILGDRLTVLHIHDNNGIGDNHLQPYSNKRGRYWLTDWEGFLAGLKDINYGGVLSFETFNAVRELPLELVPAMVNYVGSVGKYFAERLAAD